MRPEADSEATKKQAQVNAARLGPRTRHDSDLSLHASLGTWQAGLGLRVSELLVV